MIRGAWKEEASRPKAANGSRTSVHEKGLAQFALSQDSSPKTKGKGMWPGGEGAVRGWYTGTVTGPYRAR